MEDFCIPITQTYSLLQATAVGVIYMQTIMEDLFIAIKFKHLILTLALWVTLLPRVKAASFNLYLVGLNLLCNSVLFSVPVSIIQLMSTQIFNLNPTLKQAFFL